MSGEASNTAAKGKQKGQGGNKVQFASKRTVEPDEKPEAKHPRQEASDASVFQGGRAVTLRQSYSNSKLPYIPLINVFSFVLIPFFNILT